jgi:SMC interacting uncharacterized protein involved in chromosome segregation
MDELQMLLSDARSTINEMVVQIELAATTENEDEAKEAIHAAIRCGVEARDRIEESMDFAESENDEMALEEAMENIEDATDSAQLSLGGERQPLLDETRFRIGQAVASISRIADVEVE